MKAIRHTGIVVSDPERALEFYRDLLGLKTAIDFREEGTYIDTISGMKNVRLRMIKLTADDGSMIELLHYESPLEPVPCEARLNRIGPAHVAFTVNNVDEIYTQLSARGVRFNCPPQLSPDWKAKLTFCQDPDGTFLELVEEIAASE